MGQKLSSTDLAETEDVVYVELFQKPLWLTSLTFSFGVTLGAGGLIFCP